MEDVVSLMADAFEQLGNGDVAFEMRTHVWRRRPTRTVTAGDAEQS